MRLFVAIRFDEETILALLRAQENLKSMTECGNFSRRDNLHLTLAFLGEVDAGRVPSIYAAMDATEVAPLSLAMDETGYFPGGDRTTRRSGTRKPDGAHGGDGRRSDGVREGDIGDVGDHDEGDTWWIGVDGGSQLACLQRGLSHELVERGFALPHRPFVPHITIARQVRYRKPDTTAGTAIQTGQPLSNDILAMPISTKTTAISLMQSSREAGILTYTELYRRESSS